MTFSSETSSTRQLGQPPSPSRHQQQQQSVEDVLVIGRQQGWGTAVCGRGDVQNPGGATSMPLTTNATQQQPLNCGKVKEAPGDTFLNTNGVCESIVVAARYGKSAAPSASSPEHGDTAALQGNALVASANATVKADDQQHRLSLPFGSSSVSNDRVHQQGNDTQEVSALNTSENIANICDGAIALCTTNAVVPVRVNDVASPAGAEMQELLLQARLAYTNAEARLLSDGLALREDWLGTRDLFFAAGALFAAVGEAGTAARCLLHATFINRAFHSHDEAMTTLAMAVDQLKRSHPRIAVDSLLRLAPCYVKQDLRYQAARCYRDAAEILENILDEKEEAVAQYRAALDMYAETQSCAVTTAREWQRQQERRHTATLCGETTSTPPFPLRPRPFEVTGDLDNPTSPNGLDARSVESEHQLMSPKSAATIPSTTAGSFASPPSGGSSSAVAFPAHAPPAYRVSTTVQRTLSDACRWRLAVLLSRLGRFEEVREVLTACAANVPGDLPRSKYLLYCTLCMLARGASVEKKDDGAADSSSDPAAAKTETTTTTTAFVIPEVDTVYFDSLYDSEKYFLALQEEDRSFQRGKENALVRAILAANRECSLAAFDEALRTYKGYTTTEPCIVFDILAQQCRRSLYQHIELFA
ncbi:hypothetical protein JKF63_07574 [Porcisia hertigi]|uniref:Uncharacterized protein n=1 Tax=Porcisia hertigi TaxID=2761500 RepID=A0A836LM21_9TRYP|nr:hypothetical protein JKF63_07574 [Porcisia hertigi]